MIQLVKTFCPFMSQPVCNSVDGAANHYFSVIKGAGFSIEGSTRRLIAAYFGIYSRLLYV